MAAFELHDACIDEVDIELWDGAAGDVGGELVRLVGTCVVGVADILVRGMPAITAALPVAASGGQVTGNVRVTVEARHSDLRLGNGALL